MTTIDAEVEVPLTPDAALSPNHRSRSYKAKIKPARYAREQARLATLGDTQPRTRAAFAASAGAIGVRVAVCWPAPRRRQDEDNVLASLKPFLDGVADALGVNDARFRIEGVEQPPRSADDPGGWTRFVLRTGVDNADQTV